MGTNTAGVTGDLSERVTDLRDAASRQLDGALGSAEDAVSGAAEKGRDLLQLLDRTVREQPLLTLAAVAAVALAVGALWKMDHRR